MKKVYYSITPFQQPKQNDCWITTLTIFKRWLYLNNSLQIETVLEELGSPYTEFYSENIGLPHSNFIDYFSKAGLRYKQPQNFTIEGWYNNLQQLGPLIVDVIGFIQNNSVWTHTLLVVGIEYNNDDTNIFYIDPAFGTEIKVPFIDFLKKYEAEPENQIDTIQVAHR